MKSKEPNKKGFIISLVILIVGMSVGFFLLALAYSGPNWIKFLVFIVYLTILFFLIRFSRVFIHSLDEKNNEKR